jgi:phosphoglycolate phosphatase
MEKRQQRTAGPKPAVIFDFDGTIAESLPAIIQVFETMTSRPEKFTAKQVEGFRDLSVPELVRALRIPRWKAPLLVLRGRRLLSRYLGDIPLCKGIVSALQELHDADIPLYVLSSNSTENVHSYLRQHDLQKYFVGVYGGASLLGKAPRLLKMIEEEQIDIPRSWYVGDEMRDISAARAVGLKIASVAWGFNTRAVLALKEPDALVDTPAELVRILTSAFKK